MFLDSARAGAVFAVALSTVDWWYGAYGLGVPPSEPAPHDCWVPPVTGCGRDWRASTPA
ncbi:hypothetical protein ACWDZ8_08285 [Streptomyces sp. NPDC003233]